MKLWKRRQSRPVEAPSGVRFIAPDGREYPCDVLRDPDGDGGGCVMWVGVPRAELPLAGPGWAIAADVLPARSILAARLTAAVPGDS